MQLEQDIKIPELRQDLKVYKGGADFDGSPTWMLYDPLSDNFFKIGWFEFECLQRFETSPSAMQMALSIAKETTLKPSLDDVKGFVGFLLMNKLLIANTPEIQKILSDEKHNKKTSFLRDTVGKYMYTTIPLFEPDNLLSVVYPHIRFLFTRAFLGFVFILLAIGLFLTFQRWDDFLHTFTQFLSFEGILFVFLATVFVKIFHEFGHAFMAHKYKVPVSSMGIVFIIIYPILYTETTNAWRIYDRKKRINIAAAGLMAELSLASFALILWHVLSPGFFQNMAYFIAFSSLIISVFVNMNPLMKFDGYYLASDMIKIDNMQTRAIMFFRWRLHNFLFKFNDPPPEVLPEKTQKFLTLFGIALIIYRFFLYIGIAAIAYFLFFKPLGLILMIAILIMTLGSPVMMELLYYHEQRERILNNINPKAWIVTLAIIILLLFLPIHRTVKVPAVLHAQDYASIHTLIPAQIDKIYFKNGDQVTSGDLLFSLSSEELDKEIQKAQYRLDLYKKIKDREQASQNLANKNTSIEQLILEAQTSLEGLQKQKFDLNIRAQFDGIVSDIDKSIREGRTVNASTLLARIANKDKIAFTGYISDNHIERIKTGQKGKFLSDTGLLNTVRVTLVEITENDTKNITYAELSSVFGGSIPADVSRDENAGITSRIPLYQLNFKGVNERQHGGFTEKGVIALKVKPVSLAGQTFKRLISLFIRETNI